MQTQVLGRALLPLMLLGMLLFSATPLLSGVQAQGETPRPSSKLSPAEVVEIQLRALQNNDNEDLGVALVFSFASPSNRFITGPLERFIRLVKNPLYRPMLNHRASELKPIEIFKNTARQRVVIIDAQGETATFVFLLSKQAEGPFKNCWMTDGVERIDDGGQNQKVAVLEMANEAWFQAPEAKGD